MNILPNINSLLGGGGNQQSNTFVVDENLPPLEKCKRYVFSPNATQRLINARNYVHIARSVGIKPTVYQLIPLLPRIAQDSDHVIRHELGNVLVNLSEFLSQDKKSPTSQESAKAAVENKRRTTLGGIKIWSPSVNDSGQFIVPLEKKDLVGPLGYQSIKSGIFPVLHALLIDSVVEVRVNASEALCAIANLVNEDDVASVVLTLVLNLAHHHSDDQRTTAVHLMSKLAPLLGAPLCQNFVALELAAFADDSTFRVRKATAQTFGQVCKTVGTEFTVQKMLPHFVRLSRDLIWGVRKGCVESLVAVASVVPDEIKKAVLLPMFERFRTDCSRWVRNGAFEILGPFLHTLGSLLVDQKTLQLYTQIPQMTHYSNVDAEVNFFCAFNFPAVTLTVGPERWGELVDCFKTLAQDTKFPVRRTLASSIHEISKVLGPAYTERDLLPVVNAFLSDLDEVKFVLLKNLSSILMDISPHKRGIYSSVLRACQMDKHNWRAKRIIADQFDDFGLVFDADLTASAITELFFALLNDGVSSVRDAMAAKGGCLLRRLAGSRPDVFSLVQTRILRMSKNNKFQDRKLFVRICHGVFGIIEEKQFNNDFLPLLMDLTNDATPNVRILVGSFLHHLAKNPARGESKSFLEMRRLLETDKDADVKHYTTNCYESHLPSRDQNELAALRARVDAVILQDLKTDKSASAGSEGTTAFIPPAMGGLAAALLQEVENEQVNDVPSSPTSDRPATPRAPPSVLLAASLDVDALVNSDQAMQLEQEEHYSTLHGSQTHTHTHDQSHNRSDNQNSKTQTECEMDISCDILEEEEEKEASEAESSIHSTHNTSTASSVVNVLGDTKNTNEPDRKSVV